MTDTDHRITIGWRTNRNPRLHWIKRRYSPRCSCGWEKLTESELREVAVRAGNEHTNRFEERQA